MRFKRADRSFSVRAGARPVAARHSVPQGHDGTAPYLALGAPLLGIAIVLLARLILPG